MSRLYSRIYLHLLGVLLVVGLAAGLVFALGGRGALQRQLAERLVRHVGSLAAETFDDPATLERRLRQLRADLEVDVTVRGLDGRVRAAAGPELRALGEDERADLRAGELIARPGPTWFVAAAVRAPGSGAVLGFVEVSAPRRLSAWGLWRPLAGVLVVLLVIALAAGPLARRISRPVERLTEGARRLGAGDLGHRVAVDPPRRRLGRRWRRPGSDELAELTRAFNDMADRVERLVTGHKELLANVSHELRSPLARVRVALELLPRGGESEARLADVERDLAELERLIDDVLTTARLDATGLPPHPGPVDTRALLEGIAARAAHDPATAGMSVRVAVAPASGVVVGDEALLRRALWNLVENAAKYGRPPITLTARQEGARVALAVSDEGDGIPAVERERVFAPFVRLDPARTPGGPGEPPRGFGLGLTLARRIAELHGGTIAAGPAATAGGRERGCQVVIALPAGPSGSGG
jgi:signal transduction histidine kinase